MNRWLGVALMIGAAVWSTADDAEAQRQRPLLMTKKLPKVAPGESLWAHVFWQGGTRTADAIRVTVSAPEGYAIEYPGGRDHAAPSHGPTLDPSEIDFTSFRVTVPVTATKSTPRLRVTMEWVMKGKQRTRTYAVRLPVRPNRGDAVEMLSDAVGPLAPGASGWIHIDFAGREAVTGFRLVVTDAAGAGITYPGGRPYSGLSQDSTLSLGEIDYSGLRIDTAGLAEGRHELSIEIHYTEDGASASTTVPLTIGLLVSSDPDAALVSLTASAQQVTSTARSLSLRLAAGAEHAHKPFQMLGSLTGMEPATMIGGVSVPLAMDAHFLTTLKRQSIRPVADGTGVLDEAGRARATFQLRAKDFPTLVGRTYYCAFVVFGNGGVEFASNAVAVIVAE